MFKNSSYEGISPLAIPNPVDGDVAVVGRVATYPTSAFMFLLLRQLQYYILCSCSQSIFFNHCKYIICM